MRYKILDQNGLNYLTLTIVEWIDLFTRPVYKDIIIDSLKYCQEHKKLKVHAYVIMSNHLHLILSTQEEKGLSSILRSFKSHTAKQILKYLQDKTQPESRREWLLRHFEFNARKQKTHSQFQIWQRDNHPVILYSSKVIRQKLIYIHNNPVRAKIVAEPTHYIYSSASNYANGKSLLDVNILDLFDAEIGYVHMGLI